MNELIKIEKQVIGAEEINSVNARDVWQYVESKREFSNWIKDRLSNLSVVEGEDFLTILSKTPSSGRPTKEYIISLDVAKHLGMMENNSKGKEVRQYFIEAEKQANKPKTIVEVLEESVLEIKRLGKENLTLANIIKEQKPKVLFADSVSASPTSILIGQFAKLISDDLFVIGQNRLFSWLRAKGYLISSGNRYNQPMQKYIDNGYFEVIERTIVNPQGDSKITITTKITGKGQVALTRILKKGRG